MSIYYVSQADGNDSYDGLADHYISGLNGPWLTIGRADHALSAGDTLYIRAGTYHEVVNFSNNGTENSRITIDNYLAETVIIDGQDTLPTNVYYFLAEVSGDYVTLRDITIHDSHGACLVITGDYSYAINVIGDKCRESGLILTGNHSMFDGCTMTGNGWGYGIEGQGTWGSAIATIGPNNIIQNCISHDNVGEGYNAYSTANYAMFQDNIGYDNGCGLYLDSCNHVTVRRNIFYQTAYHQSKSGIGIGGETGEPSYLTVVNNLVYGWWTNFVSDSNVETADNWTIAYNTFVNVRLSAEDRAAGYNMNIYFRPELVNFINSVFKNNIILEEDPNLIPLSTYMTYPHVGFTFSYNCWSKAVTAAGQGTGDVTGDPKLTKSGPTGPGEMTGEYFRLYPNSPAINHAEVLTGVQEDYFQASRGTAPDMGACEYGEIKVITPVWITGFEYGLAAPVADGTGLFNSVVGTPSIQGTIKRSGDYAIQFVGTASDQYVRKALPVSSVQVGRFYMRFSALGTEKAFCRWIGPVNPYFGLSGSNYFRIFDGVDYHVSSVLAVVETWYRIDIKLDGTAQTLDWQIDGVAQTQIALGNNGNWSEVDLGDFSSNSATVQYDDVVYSNTPADYPIGAGSVIGLRPNADGTHANAANIMEDEDGNDIDGSTYKACEKLDENPWIATANDDLVRQSGVGTDKYCEVLFADTALVAIQGAQAILQYAAAGADADEGACIIIDEDATQTTLWGNPTTRADYSEVTAFYKSALLPTPAGGWDMAAVNALKARLGYSNDVDSVPYWLAVMLEVAIGSATASKSNYLELEILDHVFGKGSYTPPAIWVALSTTDPTEDGSGKTEPTGNGYARKSTAAGDWTTASGGAISNANIITFAAATGSWGTISHVALFDAETGGNMLYYGPVTTAKLVSSGDVVTIPVGSCQVSED